MTKHFPSDWMLLISTFYHSNVLCCLYSKALAWCESDTDLEMLFFTQNKSNIPIRMTWRLTIYRATRTKYKDFTELLPNTDFCNPSSWDLIVILDEFWLFMSYIPHLKTLLLTKTKPFATVRQNYHWAENSNVVDKVTSDKMTYRTQVWMCLKY